MSRHGDAAMIVVDDRIKKGWVGFQPLTNFLTWVEMNHVQTITHAMHLWWIRVVLLSEWNSL